jgi:hypothetical protein
MTTRSPTARAIEVPDLVGSKADEAIQSLRELGLMPVTWSAAVDDVEDAGFVLGLEPPAGSTVRAKTLITLSVATHPDFQGHTDAGLDLQPDTPMQPPLAWPLSGPTGLARPHLEAGSQPPTVAFPPAATPGASPSPLASPTGDAPFQAFPGDYAGSHAEPLASAAPADLYLHDVSAPVPTPDQLEADAEWDRLRAAEAARHAAQQPTSGAAAPVPAPPDATVRAAELDELEPARTLEDQARRDARRRSARRYRRLTGKQKALVGGVLALTLLLVGAAVSGHKPRAPRPAHAPASARRATRPTPKPGASAVLPQTPKAAPVRTRTRVVTVTLATPSPHPRATNHSARSTAASASRSSTTAASAPPAVAPAVSGNATAPASSFKPASAPVSAHPITAGTGGSTVQSPDGKTAPPQPSQP